MNTWTDITPSDVKIFLAHNIIMGLVKKSALEKYWSTNSKTRIPFFGKYISRNKFQSILWNLHISDDTGNPPCNQQGHDPLAKLRDFVDMIIKISYLHTNLLNHFHLMKLAVRPKANFTFGFTTP